MLEDACACDWADDCDGDPVDIYEGKLIKARKIHKCAECGGEIPSGKQYHRASFLVDGGWNHYKTCRSCYQMAIDLCCGQIPHGALWETLEMYMGFYPDEVPKDAPLKSI